MYRYLCPVFVVCRSGFPLKLGFWSVPAGSPLEQTFTVTQWKVIVFDPTPADLCWPHRLYRPDGDSRNHDEFVEWCSLGVQVCRHMSFTGSRSLHYLQKRSSHGFLSNKYVAVHYYLNYKTFGKNLTTYYLTLNFGFRKETEI